jgi:hypothetical protein
MASDVLTVWRTLHVEVDSMTAIPAHPHAEANVVMGNVTGIRGNGMMATRVDVDQNLNDGSPMLPDPNPNVTSGRFENGTITIGSGPQARPTPNLRGNGADYVETRTTSAGFIIPFAIVRSGTALAEGQVVALAGTTFSVRVTAGSLGQARAADSFRLPGVSMTVQSINTQNNTVTVQQLVDIPFELRDDDMATYPFNVNTSLMQYSDDPNLNRFAPAYVRPVYDLTGSREAPFNRNIVADPPNEARDQLTAGRDSTSRNDFWTVYIQGAFQEDARRDQDPISETDLIAGWTPDFDYRGALIFVEAIRDAVASVGGGSALQADIIRITVLHEVGHQFGLGDNTGGVMNQGVINPTQAVFTNDHLHQIRTKLNP